MSKPISFALVVAGALVMSHGVGAAAAPTSDFLHQAIEGDNSEVALGRLAEQRGASQEIRDFGKTLVQDHTKSREQAIGVASKLGVKPTEALSPEANQEEAKLRGMSGPDFDREFARYMVEDHQKDIHEFQQQASGTGPVAQFAEQTLPTLQKHLEIAQSLQSHG